MAIGPKVTLDQLLLVANTVFYNWDQDEPQDKEKTIRKKAEVLMAALQATAQQGPQGNPTATVAGSPVTGKGNAHGDWSQPGDLHDPVPSVNGIIGRKTVLGGFHP